MIQHILFDLDNTLYSSRYKIEDNAHKRLMDFIASYYNIPLEKVIAERLERIPFYGTTIEWLMTEKNFRDIDAFFSAAYPHGEEKELPENPDLRKFLETLPQSKAVLTNAPLEHAERILAKLNIADLFSHIFDIRYNNFKGKPWSQAFNRALDVLRAKPETTLFIDDYPNYVEGYLAIGGKGLLIDEFNVHDNYKHDKINALSELTAFL